MKSIRRLIVITPQTFYGREVLQGIHAYCRLHGSWEYHVEEDRGTELVERTRIAIRHWKADGIIAQIRQRSLEHMILRSRLPAVNISSYYDAKLPTVISD